MFKDNGSINCNCDVYIFLKNPQESLTKLLRTGIQNNYFDELNQ